jgi:hypothetical protein
MPQSVGRPNAISLTPPPARSVRNDHWSPQRVGGKAFLDRQDPEGTWAGGLYDPKWTSTTYTLLLLKRCGLMLRHPAALEGMELLWGGARYLDGGFTAAASIDAPEACIVSMYASLARRFGFDDPRVDDAVEWLLAN